MPDLVLAFDTSAAHCAAALLSGETVLAAHAEEMGRGQAERLMPMIEEMLAAQGVGWRDLSAIGVGIGPGNFTGVRIAVSAARGLALSLKIPAIGVSSLDAMAEGATPPLRVLLDARRDEAYVQDFGSGPYGAPVLIPRAQALAEADAAGLACLESRTPTELATAIARIAARRASAPQPRPAPLYLRAADAAPPSDPPPKILD
ncbi:tRNA (adenosine(37)-N6)-threonylcarbamoyltransferase complex dimerization subunit type 1 TsaB [Thioclava sp. L04-15]|uniref:tRNA (adenosine(37)-N6)-threonylcarbamoyltransferase complex dimerization subunit type 1 TsaB n=1 Tax=Thioclava sp. L04-15 TaxID=1915318 RepID=UPI0009967985|nr:tRNA (adenosine(37)-N6)-threonylcarbamoyltransferase complex dimerization subunit type 1 TsaB [Thioclava sp. L04-15]OOY29255.1 tRNA (adenosine(37)-N6)-threonylcarbamoyltransferase complex dimerization subunit type 1 TsaB [Thioclava sp. L04-15]TNE87352.1 MAG: tRNA (adenosine(37)-N6)-threonylcarbamoyltransferase complex dimerization subunit type 1 TsaB [Paracoccaceae bacterium]